MISGLSRQCLILVLMLLITMCACSETDQRLRLTSNDKVALTRVYEASAWRFQETKLNLKVLEAGAVEVLIEGVAIRRSDGGDNSLWLPAIFLPELPSYYRVTETTADQPVELQAYEVPNGLWCITLVTTVEPKPATGQAESERPSSTPLKLRLLLVSPDFASSLPILVTTGEKSGNIDASVSLGTAGQFTSSIISAGSNELFKQVEMTELPLAVTSGTTTRAVSLGPEWGEALDFSRIAYRFKTPWYFVPRPFRIAFLFLFALVLATVYYYLLQRMRASRREMRDLEDRLSILSSSDVKEIEKEHVRELYLIRQEGPAKLARMILTLLLFIAAWMLISFVLFQWALAQMKANAASNPVTDTKLTALGELAMHVENKDPNKLGLVLDFFPLTTMADQSQLVRKSVESS